MIIPFNLYHFHLYQEYFVTTVQLVFDKVIFKPVTNVFSQASFLPTSVRVSNLQEILSEDFELYRTDQDTTLLLSIRITWRKNINLHKYKGRYLVRDIMLGKKSELVKENGITVEFIQDPITFSDDDIPIHFPISLSEFPENYWLTNILELCI